MDGDKLTKSDSLMKFYCGISNPVRDAHLRYTHRRLWVFRTIMAPDMTIVPVTFDICDVIKPNQSEVGNINVEI